MKKVKYKIWHKLNDATFKMKLEIISNKEFYKKIDKLYKTAKIQIKK